MPGDAALSSSQCSWFFQVANKNGIGFAVHSHEASGSTYPLLGGLGIILFVTTPHAVELLVVLVLVAVGVTFQPVFAAFGWQVYC